MTPPDAPVQVDGGPFYTNATFVFDQLEQRIFDAVADYRQPVPWGCLLGLLFNHRTAQPSNRSR